MNEEERNAIATFMYQVLKQIHPHHEEYGLDEMAKQAKYFDEDFHGSEWEGQEYIIQAYYMKRSLDFFR